MHQGECQVCDSKHGSLAKAVTAGLAYHRSGVGLAYHRCGVGLAPSEVGVEVAPVLAEDWVHLVFDVVGFLEQIRDLLGFQGELICGQFCFLLGREVVEQILVLLLDELKPLWAPEGRGKGCVDVGELGFEVGESARGILRVEPGTLEWGWVFGHGAEQGLFLDDLLGLPSHQGLLGAGISLFFGLVGHGDTKQLGGMGLGQSFGGHTEGLLSTGHYSGNASG